MRRPVSESKKLMPAPAIRKPGPTESRIPAIQCHVLVLWWSLTTVLMPLHPPANRKHSMAAPVRITPRNQERPAAPPGAVSCSRVTVFQRSSARMISHPPISPRRYHQVGGDDVRRTVPGLDEGEGSHRGGEEGHQEAHEGALARGAHQEHRHGRSCRQGGVPRGQRVLQPVDPVVQIGALQPDVLQQLGGDVRPDEGGHRDAGRDEPLPHQGDDHEEQCRHGDAEVQQPAPGEAALLQCLMPLLGGVEHYELDALARIRAHEVFIDHQHQQAHASTATTHRCVRWAGRRSGEGEASGMLSVSHSGCLD